MPRQDKDQKVAPDGSIISEVDVTRPERVVSDELARQSRKQLRQMVAKYWDAGTGQPTGTLTLVDARNWLLALTVQIRFLAKEMDDEV